MRYEDRYARDAARDGECEECCQAFGASSSFWAAVRANEAHVKVCPCFRAVRIAAHRGRKADKVFDADSFWIGVQNGWLNPGERAFEDFCSRYSSELVRYGIAEHHLKAEADLSSARRELARVERARRAICRGVMKRRG